MNPLRCRVLVILSVLILGSAGCRKKDNNFQIKGKVSDATSGSGIFGSDVELAQQKIESGTFNSGFSFIASTETDVGGNYSFEFERENAAQYRLQFEEPDYFNREIFLNPDNLSLGEDYSLNVALSPKASVSVHIENANPFDENDKIKYQNMNADFTCACCDNDQKEFVGMDIDTTLTCDLHGNYWLKYFYQVEKDTTTVLMIDSVFCPPFTTTEVDILY